MNLVLEKIGLRLSGIAIRADRAFAAPVTGLTGPSGSGKTTLLEIVAGLRRPDAGRVILNGVTLTDVAGRVRVPPAERRVGYVPQDLALFPHLTAGGNLFFGRPAPGRQRIPAERVVEVMELGGLLDRPVRQLSGGERQRVALGRALLTSPDLLLLDEPLSSLDDRLKERILPYIRAIRSGFGVPVIYVTHSRAELDALCDEVCRMDDGVLRESVEDGGR